MGWIKYIFMWFFVFIVGSLIVSFLIYPQSFQSFKSNIKNALPEKENVENFKPDMISQNNTKTKSPEFEIIELDVGYWDRCSLIKLSAKDRGMSEKELSKILCALKCGEFGLDYYSYKCDKDKLYCYCKNG